MALVKNVIKVGNSAGLTFDQTIMKQVGWEIGTPVEIRVVEGDQLVLKPHRNATDEEAQAAGERVVRQRRKLLERLAR